MSCQPGNTRLFCFFARYTVIGLLLISAEGFAQTQPEDTSWYGPVWDTSSVKHLVQNDSLPVFRSENKGDSRYFLSHDTLWYYATWCKSLERLFYVKLESMQSDKDAPASVDMERKPWLQVHGNVHYEFQYRSYVDTPFAQRDLQQHTVETSLDIVVRDKYPLKLRLSNRQSNSPYFRDFVNVNMQFDRPGFLQKKKEELLERIRAGRPSNPALHNIETRLEALADEYNTLRDALGRPDRLQGIIEEREKRYYRGAARPAGWPEDSTQSLRQEAGNRGLSIPAERSLSATTYRMRLDSLSKAISDLRQKADSLNRESSAQFNKIKSRIYSARDLATLGRIGEENGVGQEKKKGMERFLSNVRSLGVGRSFVNYSELTAWNVALTGFHMEYSPGIYTALAAGKIDYGFRDFWGRRRDERGQNLLMGRLGFGDKDHRAIIFSAFAGRKLNYSMLAGDSSKAFVPLAGYSIEGILKKDENTSISAEVAKSTAIAAAGGEGGKLSQLFEFGKTSNIGVSIKGNTVWKRTGMRLGGFFRKTGGEFRSFSLFSYQTDQTSWLLKADQSFFKDRLGIIAMLRRNDFFNPYTEKTFKSSTVFKSVQANLRIPRLPSVSVGYYPGTQLYVIDKERVRENAYYILNGSMVYSYAFGGTRMLSSAIYNAYSSKGTDSGFIAYRGTSYMVSHSVIYTKLQIRSSYMFTSQEGMAYTTLEGGGELSLLKRLRLSVDVSCNSVRRGPDYWGNRTGLSVDAGRMGALELQYEKYYLPTIYGTLYPIKFGRLSWFKFF